MAGIDPVDVAISVERGRRKDRKKLNREWFKGPPRRAGTKREPGHREGSTCPGQGVQRGVTSAAADGCT